VDFGNTSPDHHIAGVVLAPLTTFGCAPSSGAGVIGRKGSPSAAEGQCNGQLGIEMSTLNKEGKEGRKNMDSTTKPGSPSFASPGGLAKDPHGGQSGSKSSISEERGKEAVGTAANNAMNSAGSDLQSLRNDLNSLKETVTKFVSQASSGAAKSAREVTSSVASQVGGVAHDLADRGADMASAATDQAKTFASEVENMARRNPLGAIAGAVVVGVLIGLMGRRK
jgi:ElaB/YqjD/DUF883 family membrane-anchored ribosome-binding protein